VEASSVNSFKKRLEQGCGTISDAYIHYYYKLQVNIITGSRSQVSVIIE